MPIDHQAAGRQGNRLGWVLLILATGVGGALAGMRWHSNLAAWLQPRDAAPAQPTPITGRSELWTCGMHPQVIQDHPGECPICHMKLTPLAGTAPNASGVSPGISIDPAVVQTMGVRTAPVTFGPLTRTLRLSASIAEPESGRRDINLRVSGWIQQLNAHTEGMEVHAGEPLFDLYSPDLRLAIEELIAVRRSGATMESQDALAAAAESRLLALGLSTEQVTAFGRATRAPDVVPILSPIDGHVIDKGDIYTGSAVMSGQRVLRLAQRSTMWLQGRVSEGDMGLVKSGQNARAHIAAFPDLELEGNITFIHPHMDDITRTGLVRVVVPNAHDTLREGMYATLMLDVGTPEPVLQAPREAIIDTGDTRYVLVCTPSGHFEPRIVEIGTPSDDGNVQILSGLAREERVVTSGQFLIDSESRMREAIAKYLGTATQHSAAGIARTDILEAAPSTVDGTLAAYLLLSEALGATQAGSTPLQVSSLLSALDELRAATASPDARRLVDDAAVRARALQDRSLDEQRELFKGLSAAMIALMDALPPSAQGSTSLFVVNCPMAKADWIQRSTKIANPYYAEDMKECGKVVRPVPHAAPKGTR